MSSEQTIDELIRLSEWLTAGHNAALATVVSTWGSSPRPVGSHLVINDKGEFLGSVSGGCIEGAVVAEAMEVMADGEPRVLEFGVSNEEAWDVGLSCGGAIKVYVERVRKAALLEELQRARAKKIPAAVVTRIEDGSQCLVYGDDRRLSNFDFNSSLLSEIRECLRAARSGMLADGEIFVRSYVPAYRLLIVGAVHIAQALSTLALECGYEVTIIDPRRAFATQERFRNIKICDQWPDDAMAALSPDAQTAVVTLAHDPKIDDPALIAALNSEAFYIGALGSRRTHAKRAERLTELGLESKLQRINAPVGLNLGGRSHAEIAVAILAQLIQARYSC